MQRVHHVALAVYLVLYVKTLQILLTTPCNETEAQTSVMTLSETSGLRVVITEESLVMKYSLRSHLLPAHVRALYLTSLWFPHAAARC